MAICIFTMLISAHKPEVQMLIIYEKIRRNSRNIISIPPSIRIYRLFSHKIRILYIKNRYLRVKYIEMINIFYTKKTILIENIGVEVFSSFCLFIFLLLHLIDFPFPFLLQCCQVPKE